MITRILPVLASLLLFTSTSSAQDTKKLATADIRTTAVCDMCVRTIEGDLIYEKGVKKVEVRLAENIIHVEFDPRKTSIEDLRLAVTKLGYYADDLPGDPKAYAKLPACCQKEGCGQPAEKH